MVMGEERRVEAEVGLVQGGCRWWHQMAKGKSQWEEGRKYHDTHTVTPRELVGETMGRGRKGKKKVKSERKAASLSTLRALPLNNIDRELWRDGVSAGTEVGR
jgi:hypothetical protein